MRGRLIVLAAFSASFTGAAMATHAKPDPGKLATVSMRVAQKIAL